jgi:hypothetical protein
MCAATDPVHPATWRSIALNSPTGKHSLSYLPVETINGHQADFSSHDRGKFGF